MDNYQRENVCERASERKREKKLRGIERLSVGRGVRLIRSNKKTLRV